MENDEFVVITWPEIQDLQDMIDFEENAHLILESTLMNEYGGSAYFVRKTWLKA